MEFDEDLMIPDKRLSHCGRRDSGYGMAVAVRIQSSFTYAIIKSTVRRIRISSLNTPYQELPEDVRDMLIYGTGGRAVKVHYRGQRGEGVYDVAFEGLIQNVNRRYRETGSDAMKQQYEEFMRITPCTCMWRTASEKRCAGGYGCG